MVPTDWLKQICQQPGEGKAYYRPFICNGDLSKVDIFLVGINPATPIYPHNMDIDSYVKLILNYDQFMRFYKANRIAHGKSELTRTRKGMNSFLSWLSKNTDSEVLQTEAIPYPAESVELLEEEPDYVIEKGKDIFYQLVMEFKPRLLILHGKESVKYVIKVFEERGLITPGKVNLKLSIKDMEKESALCEFHYPNGKAAVILACRHFRWYGFQGNSFEPFRKRVLERLRG